MLQAKTFRRVVSVSLVAGGLAFAGTSHAADDVSVTYRSYELTTPEGVQVLYHRLEQRAENHCLANGRIAAERACVRDLVNDLVTKLDNPQLTSLHRSASPLIARR